MEGAPNVEWTWRGEGLDHNVVVFSMTPPLLLSIVTPPLLLIFVVELYAHAARRRAGGHSFFSSVAGAPRAGRCPTMATSTPHDFELGDGLAAVHRLMKAVPPQTNSDPNVTIVKDRPKRGGKRLPLHKKGVTRSVTLQIGDTQVTST